MVTREKALEQAQAVIDAELQKKIPFAEEKAIKILKNLFGVSLKKVNVSISKDGWNGFDAIFNYDGFTFKYHWWYGSEYGYLEDMVWVYTTEKKHYWREKRKHYWIKIKTPEDILRLAKAGRI